MPTETWNQLDPERREAVTVAAEREFALHGFSEGSMNAIARNAGVAKGSLFQYFADKADLCHYVSERSAARVRDHMTKELAVLSWADGFIESVRDLVLAWIAYFEDHPVDRALTESNMLERDPRTRRAVRGPSDRHYIEFLRPLLHLARDAKLLAVDSDLDALLALMLLVAPHAALAPHSPGLDPVLGLDSTDPQKRAQAVERLIRAVVVQHT